MEFELGATTPAPAPAGDLIKDTNEATFMQDVVEASQEVPVIVDFWAPWCGPCKTLGPALEAAVTKAGGRVKMVKVNIDENQMIATQMQIQSVPTVFAFFKGQPIDGFQGNVPASELNEFVERVAAQGPAPDNGLADAINAAQDMLDAGDFEDAAQTFEAILQEDPAYGEAFAGLARAHVAMGNPDEAEAVLNGAPADSADSTAFEAVRAQIELARQAQNAGPTAELQSAVDENPDNHQARFDLAVALNATGDVQGAVDELLDLFRRDRDWNDGAAKTQLFIIFEALEAKDPIALTGRRKLSSMIFM